MKAGNDLSREDVLHHLRSRKGHFRKAYHVRKIALIGSFARNEYDAQSDIDVLVDLEEGTPDIFDVKRALKQELEERFGRPVDIASERYLKPYYRTQILQEAVYA